MHRLRAIGGDAEAAAILFGQHYAEQLDEIDPESVKNLHNYFSPAQVREQVLSRCETFAPGGGFVFNAIHNIQACTPIANVIAMVDAVHHFNGRR